MQVESEDSKHPEKREQPLEDGIKQKAIDLQVGAEHEFEIIAEVGMGVCLPGQRDYKIKIKIAEFELITDKPKESKQGYNRWGHRFAQTTFKLPYPNVQSLDRVYVYLMDGNSPICYWKGHVLDFLNPDPGFKWLPFKNDLAIGTVKNAYEAGLIQVKMSINDRQTNGPCDFSKLDAWKKPPPRRLQSFKIRCFIFQCRNIPSADTEGTSDAYITVWNPDGKQYQT